MRRSRGSPLEILEKRLRDAGLDAVQFRFERIGVDATRRGADAPVPNDLAEVRVRVAGRVRTEADAERIGREVTGLWLNGPAGGGGARRIGDRGDRDPFDDRAAHPGADACRVGRGLTCCSANSPTRGPATRAAPLTSPSSPSTPRHTTPLRRELSPDRIRAHFADLPISAVDRYELQQLHALKFVLHGALGGGVTQTLNLDAHGKCLASCLLALIHTG